MSRRSIAPALLIALLTGCTMSLQELRHHPPTRTALVADRQYDVLAGCVAEGLQMGQQDWINDTSFLNYAVISRPEQRRITITGYLPHGFRAPWPFLDLTFIQRDHAVSIESRIGDFAGGEGGVYGSRIIQEKAWPIIEQCAGGAKLSSP